MIIVGQGRIILYYTRKTRSAAPRFSEGDTKAGLIFSRAFATDRVCPVLVGPRSACITVSDLFPGPYNNITGSYDE